MGEVQGSISILPEKKKKKKKLEEKKTAHVGAV
jgi:hypothetical protein